MEIDPRGKVYEHDGSCKQWTRVINGTVYHFFLSEASTYWGEPASVQVRRHPYGNIRAMETVHDAIPLP